MAGRSKKPEVNRRDWHSARVAEARTPKAALWAYCHWLVAEAFHAGPEQLEAATRLIRDQINALIQARKAGTR